MKTAAYKLDRYDSMPMISCNISKYVNMYFVEPPDCKGTAETSGNIVKCIVKPTYSDNKENINEDITSHGTNTKKNNEPKK